jgi:predicted PurR-regulated permease PerM
MTSPRPGPSAAARARRRNITAAEDDEGHVRRMSSRGTIAVLTALAVFLYLIRHILLPFVIAGAVAYALTPGVDWVARRTHLPRVLWAVVLFFAIVFAAAGLGYFAAPSFMREAGHIITDFHGIVTSALSKVASGGKIDLLGQQLTTDQAADKIVTAVRNWVTTGTTAFVFLGYTFTLAFGVILTIVILFYFLVGGRKLGAGLFTLVPPHQRPLVDRMWAGTDPVLKRYFIGIAVVVCYAMVASYIGLGVVLGLSHAGLLAVLTGLLEMIPVIGPAASAVIAGLVALHHAKSMWAIGGYLVYAVLLRISIDEFLGPIVLGRAAHVPAVMVIFCFLSGGLLFGIAGVIMAVPVALTIKIVLATLYDEWFPVDDSEPVVEDTS